MNVGTYTEIDVVSGFTGAEKRCHDALMKMFDEYINLPNECDDDLPDFVTDVHDIQRILGMRIVRRMHPEYWRRNLENPARLG